MNDGKYTERREFLGMLSALGVVGLRAGSAFAQQSMPLRSIPNTGETLPVIGLGSSKVVQQIASNGTEPVANVLRTLVAHGGSVVDTWPRNPDNDSAFGRVINAADLRDSLFITTKIDQVGKEAGIRQFRQTQQLYGRQTLDLVQIFSLTDLDVHWPSLKEWKETGHARYIGVTVAQYGLYDQLEEFLGRESPDFIQINYSITERRAEDRLIPLASDKGIAIIINRPFMNGAYFNALEDQPLPDWTAEFDCGSWAQFSLQYILANPQITCVLTETANPTHMQENAQTAFSPTPSTQSRQRMRAFIDAV